MRTRLTLIVLLITALLRGSGLLAQDLSYLPAGLHKLTEDELMYEDLSLTGLPLYFKGKRISYKAGPKMKVDPAYMLDYYADEAGEIKAVVIRPSTAEERAIKEDPDYLPDPGSWKNGLPPEFSVEDLEGKTVNLADMEGKVVVLNFWYVSCKPCVKEMPELNAIVEKYKNEDVVFLAFATDKAPAVEQFLTSRTFNYRIIPRARHISKKFGVYAYPSHYVIDKKGIVRFYQKSYRPGTGNRIDHEISELLIK
ncbi:MAG: hypothetical protein Roseis2KO_04910 [Roseivirga sp.]